MIKRIIHFCIKVPLELINYPIKHSQWYNNLFIVEDGELYPNNKWYREHDERNYDLVVIGSSSAKWGFDFSSFNIKAMNWAQAPQTLVEDYNILRNFHSILRKGGFVIITIMPFTSLNKKTGIYDALKYIKISTHEPIEPHLLNEAKRCFNYPILLGKPAIKAGIRYLLKREHPHRDEESQMVINPMNEEQLLHNAQCFVENWKRQFGIKDINAPLSRENRINREYRIKLMQTIIDFCEEREYNPIIVIPPITKYLAQFFTPQFKDTYINSFIKEIDRNFRLLDYSNCIDLCETDLFFNSFFLNRKGRILLTKRLMSDLNLIQE